MTEDKLPRRIAWFAPWSWKRRTQIIVGLLLTLVGYVLSAGPVYKLMWNGWISMDLYYALYNPAFTIAGILGLLLPVVGDAWEWYMKLFFR